MGTRGAIARLTGEGFGGRYHHWDSYPEGLGATLFALRNGHFAGDTEAMLKTLIDDHPAGWSTINGKDFAKPAGFEETGRDSGRPLCYCHGDRKESEQILTQADAAACGAEYAYVFTPDAKMIVLSSYRANGSKMIGMFGSGDPESRWATLATVDLNGTEPDWKSMTE